MIYYLDKDDFGIKFLAEPLFPPEVIVHEVQKPVREFLRSGDVLLELLRNGTRLSEHELTVLRAYTTQIQSFLVLQEVRGARALGREDWQATAANTAESDGR